VWYQQVVKQVQASCYWTLVVYVLFEDWTIEKATWKKVALFTSGKIKSHTWN
jgi:hypothetical protein